jgi:hypothetical protein
VRHRRAGRPCAGQDNRRAGAAQPGDRHGAAEPGHGPELCLGFIADSFPPLCGGLPITNWRWDQVEAEQAAGGTTWGTYRLVGIDHGASFTVIRVDPPPPVSRPSAERFKDAPRPACPEPAGGWEGPDPSRRSERYLEPVTRAARAQPDFAGLWMSYLAPMGDNVAEDPGEFVLNVAFTGDLARHQAQLRPRWGGRLCVTGQQRSYRELLGIQRQLQGAAGKELGLRVLGTSIDESANAVDLQVVVLEEQPRAALEAWYGAGAVQATAALTPHDGTLLLGPQLCAGVGNGLVLGHGSGRAPASTRGAAPTVAPPDRTRTPNPAATTSSSGNRPERTCRPHSARCIGPQRLVGSGGLRARPAQRPASRAPRARRPSASSGAGGRRARSALAIAA